MVVRIQHDGNHNPSSTQKLGKGGSPGEENSICSSGEVAEAEVQASIFTGGWSPWRPGYTPPLPSAGMWPRAAHQLLCTVPSSGASTVPGTQYVYRYSLSIYIYCIYMASPPQPGSSSIFHNSSRFFHPIFMIFSNSKESVPLLLLLLSLSHVWLFCDPMDCSPPGSSVHGILQTRILEWVAMPSSRGSSQLRD